MLGAVVLGIVCGVVGCFAVLRRRALLGDAVAHAALPGICVAFMVVGERNVAWFLLGALVFGLIAAGCIALVRGRTRVKDDAVIAIVIGSFFGLGIVLSRFIQNTASGNQAGIDGFIFGKAASMVWSDAMIIVAAAAIMLFVVVALYKELRLVTFDEAFARAIGRPVQFIDGIILAMVCVCTVVGLPAVGVVMVVALLVIPAVAARCWTNSLAVMLILAGAIGALSASVGTGLSAVLPAPGSDAHSEVARGAWPTGPMIVLCAGAICVVSLVFAPRRGVIAGVLRSRAARRELLLARAVEHAARADLSTRGTAP